ncbi:Bardet-Biedl syndrome 4 isoform X1 [Lycorma delicatula]|uniref:Bardet-Biedl syndrome 4 isoform X1 n=1 Tax=Lycorma delicatula TaxID=130591 RepID=UPI003F517EA4
MNHSNLNGSIANRRVISAVSRPQPNLYKGSEFPPVESRNWLIHSRYVRKEYEICKLLIADELEKSNGYNEYANYVLGLILRQEGKIQDSLEYFQKCHTLNPQNVENVKQVARSLFLLGRHQLAIEAYLEAEKLAQSPDANIYQNLGECCIRVGQLSKAKEYLNCAVQLGKSEESYVSLAELYKLQDDLKSATEIYNAALQLYPSSSELYTALGLLYMKLGEYQLAFDKLGSALAHDPMCTKALLAAGSIIQNSEEYDVALAKYKVAAQYLPESPSLWNNVGMCFFGKKKYVAAISCLKRANYLAPLDWKILYNLGLVHLYTKQYASAFNFLSASIKFQHKHAPTFMLLASALKNLDDVENACKAYEQAIKLDPEDAAVRVNYAAYLQSISETHRGLEQMNYFRKIAQKIPRLDKELLEIAKTVTASLTRGIVAQPAKEVSVNATNDEVLQSQTMLPDEV